ncbi:uncharacterized protein PAC_15204 [Phialocephala subalpina]|uniref:Something about silencing protein 4 domain-containing protein n=1 Tax=Phialocephala subalpina TaxID=576137 RepID=A0A1L7XJX1_9HELO|nr:uncharacterized protein PAC_15204 [Phialocephala subalpina]
MVQPFCTPVSSQKSIRGREVLSLLPKRLSSKPSVISSIQISICERQPPPEPHELDRLQPSAADLKDEKRKLRSQEGTRFKSELLAYFPEYNEIIGNEPQEEHVLIHDTPPYFRPPKASLKKAASPPKSKGITNGTCLKDDPESAFTDLHNSHRIDSSFLSRDYEDEPDDPLSDEYFESIHRKPERQERSIRNTDKGRAQKTMSLRGHTSSEAAMAEAAEDDEEEVEEEVEEEEAGEEKEIVEEDEGNVSDGDPPDYSDVDASAARQLHEEAIARSTPALKNGRGRPKAAAPIPQPVQEVEKPFTSFFSKPYLREAALGKHRRSGRSVAAWGHPVPEVDGQDFDLPEEYRDVEDPC